MSSMIDLVYVFLKAGDGGHGRVSFRREKYVPKGGPDGGDGGNGGSVILQASDHKATLQHLAGVKDILAKAGDIGGKRNMTGAKGDDVVIEVPVGTVVWELAAASDPTDPMHKKRYHVEKDGQAIPEHPFSVPPHRLDQQEISFSKLRLGDFRQLPKTRIGTLQVAGESLVVCQGGRGGRGNTAFKSGAMTTPLQAEYGTLGDEKIVALELQLLADVGLIGLPNAGKSTLLSKLTQARPKVANYPFTTLAPHLGLLHHDGIELVLADIPGLIEGASQGKGLGHQFLRHVMGCRVLWYVVYLDETVAYDESLSAEEKAELVWQQYQELRTELQAYDTQLPERPSVVTFNKIDVYPPGVTETVVAYFASRDVQLQAFSALSGEGLDQVIGQVVGRSK